MNNHPESDGLIATSDTLFPRLSHWIARSETMALLLGIAAAILRHGYLRVTQVQQRELAAIVVVAMLVLTLGPAIRYGWSRARSSFLRERRLTVGLSGLWIVGLAGLLLSEPESRAVRVVAWTEICLGLRAIIGFVTATQFVASGRRNPAFVLVASFAVLVLLGTVLLMLPRARAQTSGEVEGAPLLVAFFTATSAGCVTGLTIVPTGTYWSRTGQLIILGLFQLGGLGIMTFGAFFAIASGRRLEVRETAKLRDMLESDGLGDVRRLILTILAFTLSAELLGALLMSGLWSNYPFLDQCLFSAFHSISAFCNAGFSLTYNSFGGLSTRWQIWGVASGLIVSGGLGFAVMYNLALAVKTRIGGIQREPLFNLPRERVRLALTTRLVLITTVVLLLIGCVGCFLLEAGGTYRDDPLGTRISDAWFQAVTFRTAGFNTVNHGDLQPATKLLAIGLMFIGASPGSTGGGVKTVCFALAVMAMLSSLRGRNRVEIFGRTIPAELVNRALAILSLGIVAVMTTTMALVLFEDQPQRFLDHLFEATSAFGTVGVSTGITSELTTASKLVIAASMFLGRVGPLTLLIALMGETKPVRYDYPQERVTLG